MRRVCRLYAAAALSRLADAITAWRLEHGLLTAEEEATWEALSARIDREQQAHRDAWRPPPIPRVLTVVKGGDA